MISCIQNASHFVAGCRTVKWLEEKPYEKQLRTLGLFSLEKTEGRPHCDLQHLCEGKWRGKYPSFTLVTSDRTRGYGTKLSQGRFGLDIRKMFFTQRVVGHCSSSGKWSQHQPV